MFEEFTYENHLGEVITFGKNGVYANYNNLRDYSWSYNLSNGRISKMYRDASEKTLPVVFIGRTGEQCRTNRNTFFEIVEKDVLTWVNGKGRYGKLTIGDYYLNCILIAAQNSEYLRSEKLVKTSYTALTDDPVWRREHSQFYPIAVAEDQTEGKSYPYDYPYNYSASAYKATSVDNPCRLGSTHIMTIYGPCESPSIIIGGHQYQMMCDLYEGEQIVIDSANKTITMVGIDRSEQNYFGYRRKDSSIFEPIPPGISTLAWSGAFGFDLTFIETRSEPNWIYMIVPDDVRDAIESDDGTFYLLDSENRIILDDERRAIKVEV